MQRFLSAWDRLDSGGAERHANRTANVLDVECLDRLQRSLGDPPMDDDELRRRLDANYALLERLARTWQQIAAERHPS